MMLVETNTDSTKETLNVTTMNTTSTKIIIGSKTATTRKNQLENKT